MKTIEQRAHDYAIRYDERYQIAMYKAYIEGSIDQLKIGLSNGWISVDDHLPAYCQSVLVCVNGTRVVTNRTKNDYSKDRNDFIHVVIAADATHWMPLPEPPETK